MLAAASIFSVAACSGPTEEHTTKDVTSEEAPPSPSPSGAAAVTEPEVFEFCDENGDHYPSETDAEAAGLDRAEYGATFCDHGE